MEASAKALTVLDVQREILRKAEPIGSRISKGTYLAKNGVEVRFP